MSYYDMTPEWFMLQVKMMVMISFASKMGCCHITTIFVPTMDQTHTIAEEQALLC
jgi:hypothetical protein